MVGVEDGDSGVSDACTYLTILVDKIVTKRFRHLFTLF